MENKKLLRRKFIKYVSSNILGMLGLSCYILADTFFIANKMGENGLTALNLILPVYSFISGLGLMLGMGGASFYSISQGMKKNNGKNSIFTSILCSSAALGILFAVLGTIFSVQISSALGADAVVRPFSEVYIKVLLLFAAAHLGNQVLICFVRNDGNPKLSMYAMLAGSMGNIVLDYIFMYPFDMGMFGAVFATCMAPIISIMILSIHWISGKSTLKICFAGNFIRDIRNTLKFGIPFFITEFSTGITILLFNFIILNLEGNMGIAAYGITANIAIVVTSIFNGTAQGIQPLLSAEYGEGRGESVKQIYRMGVFLSVFLGILCYAMCVLYAEPLIAAFNRNQDADLAKMALLGIQIYFSAFVVMGNNIVTVAYFASVARTSESFCLSFIRGFAAVIFYLIILSNLFGMKGVWMTVPFTELTVLLISTGLLFLHKKRKC